MVGQVRPAVDAAVGAVAGRQVRLEGLGLGHLYHVSGAGLLAGVRAGTGRVAALLDLLTEETLEDAGKSRRCCGVGVWDAPHRRHRRKSSLQERGGTEVRGVRPIYRPHGHDCTSRLSAVMTIVSQVSVSGPSAAPPKPKPTWYRTV